MLLMCLRKRICPSPNSPPSYSRLSWMMATRCSESTMLLREAPLMTASFERHLTEPGPEVGRAKEGAVGP